MAMVAKTARSIDKTTKTKTSVAKATTAATDIASDDASLQSKLMETKALNYDGKNMICTLVKLDFLKEARSFFSVRCII